MSNWDDRRIFLAIARQGSLNRAAISLGINRSTVLRRITAFEKELGIRLFERLPSGYFLTSAGEEMMMTAEQMEKLANDTDRRFAGKDEALSGAIRISIPGALASYVLMPDIAVFTRENPQIHLEIMATFDMPDLEWREVDVAIRISNNPPKDLVGRRILKIARTAYVCEKYLPSTKYDPQMPPLSWIGWPSNPSTQNWYKNSNHPELPTSTVISDPYSTVKAIQTGMGMSILPCFMGDSEPKLFRMQPEKLILQTDIWVLIHPDLRNTARIRLFADFIVDSIKCHRDLLEGNRPNPMQ